MEGKMITKIKGKGFKGTDFIDSIGRLNLYIGPNGSGKTARSMAVALAVQGYVPSQGKTNQAIFQAGASPDSDRFAVEVESNYKVSFYRRWLKRGDGTVTVDVLVNGRKASTQVFAAEMARCGGGYVIADISLFMGLSDRKKIDEIFRLYPPDDDMANIEQELEEKREALNRCQQQFKNAEKIWERLTNQKERLEQPQMPLEDCKSEYDALSMRLIELRRAAQEEQNRHQQETHINLKPDVIPSDIGKDVAPSDTGRKDWQPIGGLRQMAIDALETVLKTMMQAGCTSCAAGLIAKKQLKRIRGAEA
jgi:hypothetical protein